MLDATRDALLFADGRSRIDLDDAMLYRALINCVEVIGEAASRTSTETRLLHPSKPWMQMTAMRNRLIHAHHDVNRDILWSTVVKDLPSLERDLIPIVGTDNPAE